MTDFATTDLIEGALYDVIRALAKDQGGPFALVERFAAVGDQPTKEEIVAVTGGKAPAALVSWEADEPVAEARVDTLVGFDSRQVTRATFRVYVIVHDTRSDRRAVKGDDARKGILGLVRQVKRAILGLRIEGLAGDEMVRLLRSAPSLVAHGEMYVSTVRVSADYEEELVEHPDTSVPFKGVDGEIDTDGITDPEDGLVVPFSHRFE